MSQTPTNPPAKPALVLAVNWLAGNSDPVELPSGSDRLVLHLEALRDIKLRSVRFHFVDGFLGEPTPASGGPQARCLIGECGPITGGRLVHPRGLTRKVAARTVKLRERVPHAPGVAGRVRDQFIQGLEFWKWAPGLIADQMIGGPHDLWHLAAVIEVPEGSCLGFAVCGLTHPCRVRIEVGGE